MLYMLFNRKNKQMFLQKNDSTMIHSVTKIRNKYLSKRLFHKALHTAFKGLYVAIVDFKWTTTFSTRKTSPIGRKRVPFPSTDGQKWDESPGGRYQNY